MSTTKIFSGLLAVTLTSAALYAAPGMTADANGDKAVTKTEALAAADAHFAKMDANGDGMLNEADKAAMVKKHFAEMDADKNGAINEAEFVAAHEARADKRDERHEMRMGHGGHEGKMGRHGGGMKMLGMADTNGDKAVSKAEFRHAAEARFAKADTNGDGTISVDERKAQHKGKWGHERGPMPSESEAG
jgi:EF hand